MSLITGLDLFGKDNSARLQEVFTNAPDGTRLELPPGQIRTEKQVYVSKKKRIKLSGAGRDNTVLYRQDISPDRNNSFFNITHSQDVSMIGFGMKGSNPFPGDSLDAYDADLEGQHGIEVEGSFRVFLDGIGVSSVFGDGVYVDASYSDHIVSEDVCCQNSVFLDIGRQGSSVVGGRNVLLTRNIYHRIRHAVWDCEPLKGTHDWVAENVHMTYNILGTHRLLALAAKGAGPNVKNIVCGWNLQLDVIRGFFQIFAGAATTDTRTGLWVIYNTSLHDPIVNPVRLQRWQGAYFLGNKIPTVDTAFVDADYVSDLYGGTGNNNILPCKKFSEGTAVTPTLVYTPPPPTPNFATFL